MHVNSSEHNLPPEDTQQLIAAIRQSVDSIAITNLDGVIQFANPAWAKLHGYGSADFTSQHLSVFHTEEQMKAGVLPLIERSRSTGAHHDEIGHVTRDGTPFLTWTTVTLLKDAAGNPTGFVSVARDITERKRAEEALRDQTTHDALTGALNHRAIVEELYNLPDEADVCHTIAMVDVDGLKATNDTYGHQVGDAVLVAVVNGLARDDVLVGRYGGDEFVVLLRGADRDTAEQYRNEVLATLSGTTVQGENDAVRVPIYVSMGLATYPDEADTIKDALRLADSAMYTSRQEKSGSPSANGRRRLLGKERAARLVAEIVPLLTRAGTREEKLKQVAHHLSVGAGYDAVNFEVTGDVPEPPEWQSTFVRAPKDLVDAWMREQSQNSNDHPLGQILEQTRRPIFIDRVATDDRLTDKERELLAASGIQSGLVVPMIWQDGIVGMLSVGSNKETAFHSWDAQFLTAVASQVTAIVFMTTLVEELQSASDNIRQAHAETVMMLAAVAEAHDNTTGRHLQRVRAITEALARDLGYSDEKAKELGLAAVLHDIGKIQVPDTVLRSSEKLSEQEWAIMKQHTIWGAEFLRGRRGFALAEIVAHSHHERWDGGGYPSGLKGDEISEAAAITTVADSFDAITSDRPYRSGRPPEEALKEIVAWSGKQFNPRVVEALVRLHERGALPLGADTQHQAAA